PGGARCRPAIRGGAWKAVPAPQHGYESAAQRCGSSRAYLLTREIVRVWSLSATSGQTPRRVVERAAPGQPCREVRARSRGPPPRGPAPRTARGDAPCCTKRKGRNAPLL